MSAHVVKMCYLLAIITSFLGRVMIFTYAGEIESFHLAAPLASKCGKWSLESSRTVELLKRGPLKPNEIFSLHQSLVKCIIFLFLSLKMTKWCKSVHSLTAPPRVLPPALQTKKGSQLGRLCRHVARIHFLKTQSICTLVWTITMFSDILRSGESI